MGNCVIIIILFGLSLPCSLSRRYFYQTQLLTWDEAQENCQKQYGDLATFESQEDIDSLQDRPTGLVGEAWIGLRDDPSTWKQMGNASTSWRWSETGETSQSGFSNWLAVEPNNLVRESCVQIDSSGFWYDASCDLTLPSVCVSNTSFPKYEYNPTWMKWSVAQEYCRQNYDDLVSIESDQVNVAVKKLVPWATVAWIGLYRIPFAWADHSPSTFRNWGPLLPDNFMGIEFCGVETELHMWNDVPCTVKYPSICAKPDWKTRKTTLRLTLSSACDVREPGVLQQIQQQLTERVSQDRTDVHIQLKIVMEEETTGQQYPNARCV